MDDSQTILESASSRERGASPGSRIGLAATTGVGAKALALAAQVLAVAIAVRALGAGGSRCMWSSPLSCRGSAFAGLGVAPGLTLGIARASAVGDRAEEARLFAVALLLMTAIATIVVGGALFLGASGVVDHFIADRLRSASGDASAALLCMALLVAVQLVVVVPEAAQLGLQRQYVSNIWAGIGSAAAIVAMLTVGGAVNSVTAFVLVSQGPQVGARAANSVSFVLRRRYLLRPRGLRFRQEYVPSSVPGSPSPGSHWPAMWGSRSGYSSWPPRWLPHRWRLRE